MKFLNESGYSDEFSPGRGWRACRLQSAWLVHPTGRQRLVPKVEPETGEADGIGYAYHAS